MKNINLITGISAQKFEKFKQWQRITVMLLSGIIIILVIKEFNYIFLALDVKKKASYLHGHSKIFNQIMDQKQQLKKQVVALQTKINHIKLMHKNNPGLHITTLGKIDSFHLESFTVVDNNIEIKGWISSVSLADKLMHKLSAMPFLKNLKITAIIPQQRALKEEFNITIIGQLN